MSFSASDQNLALVKERAVITVQVTDRLSARLYEDSYPHVMETAALQKGLVLVLDGEELIEEGLGFGAPVVKYLDKTYFSSLAEISMKKNPSSTTLSKRYIMDTVSKKKFWRATYINDSVYSSVRKTFEKAYVSKKELSPFFNAVMELRQIAKIKTEFIRLKPRGAITVTYDVNPQLINVSVDLSNLSLSACEEILVLNEQGATTFERYSDSGGLKLFRRGIGAWDSVTADWASLGNIMGGYSFSLQRIQGAALFRGWERTRNRFSWAGLSYSMAPGKERLNYSIRFNV
ncbi:MAG: hypothetical protein ACLQO7_14000 [Candidatus Bathyarchaeia archaeon]